MTLDTEQGIMLKPYIQHVEVTKISSCSWWGSQCIYIHSQSGEVPLYELCGCDSVILLSFGLISGCPCKWNWWLTGIFWKEICITGLFSEVNFSNFSPKMAVHLEYSCRRLMRCTGRIYMYYGYCRQGSSLNMYMYMIVHVHRQWFCIAKVTQEFSSANSSHWIFANFAWICLHGDKSVYCMLILFDQLTFTSPIWCDVIA
jgi:hypothetical protein